MEKVSSTLSCVVVARAIALEDGVLRSMLTCEICQKVFSRAPAHLPKRALCSRECRRQAQGAKLWTLVHYAQTGCWLWTGRRQADGYGSLSYGGQSWLAHRLAWTLTYGEIPPELCVCHHCDTPACINPDHLFVGTRQDNNADRDAKGRRGAVGFHPETHPYATRARGERQHSAKLTAEHVLEIRAKHQQGMSQRAIARQYGMAKSSIDKVVQRKTWTHI